MDVLVGDMPAKCAGLTQGVIAAWLLLALMLVSGEPAAQVPVDLDHADAEVLAQTLPGIGPVKARRIVEYRQRHGPFTRVEDLESVKGIGPATMERIRAYLGRGANMPMDNQAQTRADAGVYRKALSSTEHEQAARRAIQQIVQQAQREASAALH